MWAKMMVTIGEKNKGMLYNAKYDKFMSTYC